MTLICQAFVTVKWRSLHDRRVWPIKTSASFYWLLPSWRPPLNEEIESENVINDDHLLGRALGLGQTMPPPRCKTTVFRRATNGPLTKFEVEWQKTDFGPKTEYSGPKKRPLLNSDHVLATNGKSCANKKSTLFQNEYQSLGKFWVFLWEKTDFWPKNHFSAKH